MKFHQILFISYISIPSLKSEEIIMGDPDPEEDSDTEILDYDEDYEILMEKMSSQFNPNDHDDNMGESGTIDFQQPSYDSEEGGGQVNISSFMSMTKLNNNQIFENKISSKKVILAYA